LFGPTVKIIEIHKLAEEPSKEGVSILLEELGSSNLVFVDEGHKGTGSEAQTWKTRQKRLSANGFLLEYSATFAQSIGSASQKAQKDLLAEYGKSILFDYSYRHFYEDGYGKDFHILNFSDQDTGEDLFTRHLTALSDNNPKDVYRQLAGDVFQGRGGLEIWELKGAEGEIGLRISGAEGKESPYFGVINIGDVSAFKKHLEERLGIEVHEDRFHPSLFAGINRIGSPVTILIGSKKFIEGWSNWRVSAMGLLNMGKGEGPQVIQLFGRGVRLKGKKWTLKRSSFLPEEGPHPDGLPSLERLLIFGWNADYIQAFRKMLEQEDLGKELQVNVRMQYKLWKNLPIPKPKKGYKVDSETWTLQKEKLPVRLDLTPRLALVEGTSLGGGLLGKPALVDFGDESIEAMLDLDALYTDLVEYKTRRGYQNTFIPRSELLPILQGCDLYVPSSDLKNPAFLQEGASRVIRMYLDRFVAAKERSAEGGHLEPGYLSSVSIGMLLL